MKKLFIPFLLSVLAMFSYSCKEDPVNTVPADLKIVSIAEDTCFSGDTITVIYENYIATDTNIVVFFGDVQSLYTKIVTQGRLRTLVPDSSAATEIMIQSGKRKSDKFSISIKDHWPEILSFDKDVYYPCELMTIQTKYMKQCEFDLYISGKKCEVFKQTGQTVSAFVPLDASEGTVQIEQNGKRTAIRNVTFKQVPGLTIDFSKITSMTVSAVQICGFETTTQPICSYDPVKNLYTIQADDKKYQEVVYSNDGYEFSKLYGCGTTITIHLTPDAKLVDASGSSVSCPGSTTSSPEISQDEVIGDSSPSLFSPASSPSSLSYDCSSGKIYVNYSKIYSNMMNGSSKRIGGYSVNGGFSVTLTF